MTERAFQGDGTTTAGTLYEAAPAGSAWPASPRSSTPTRFGLPATAASSGVGWPRRARAPPVHDATSSGDAATSSADGASTHNSLEQDADMVVLLHREDA